MSDRILIAEDNKNLCRILESALSEAGYEVAVALGGDAAVHEIKSHPFDLVISDIGLPDLSGYDLMTQLKASYGSRGIALTGYGSREDISRSKAAGFMAHLTKPVESDALDAALEQFLTE